MQKSNTTRTPSWLMCLALVAMFPIIAQSQNTWTGAAGTTNWSDGNNWNFSAPPQTYDTVVFDNTLPGAGNGVIDNIVNQPFTITALQYQSASTNGYHTTLIPAGMALRLDGTYGDVISIGTGVAQGGQNVQYRVVGGGILSATNTTGTIRVVQGGSDADHFAILDLGGLTNFFADVDQVNIAGITDINAGNRPMGRIVLAETNFLRTAPGTTKPGIIVAAHQTDNTERREPGLG